MKKLFFAAIALFVVTALAPLSFSAVSEQPIKQQVNVLMILSYDMTNRWTQRITSTIEHDLREGPVQLNFDYVALDAMRQPDPTVYAAKFLPELTKINDRRYSLIVAVDDAAVDLLIAQAQNLPADLPIVFCGVESRLPSVQSILPNSTGVVLNTRIEDTIRAGLALYPACRTVAIIHDTTPAGYAMKAKLQSDLRPFHGIDLRYISQSGNNVDKLFAQINELPPNSIVILTLWRTLNGNDYQSFLSFGTDLISNTNLPVFLCEDTLLGHGALGGFMVQSQSYGSQIAQLIRKVISQGSAKNLPVGVAKEQPFFDYLELASRDLDIAKLPKDSALINEPPSIWRAFPVGLSVSILLIVLTIAGLTAVLFAICKRIRRQLTFYNALPGRIVVVNRAGKILYIRPESERDRAILAAQTVRDIPDISENVLEKINEVFQTQRPMNHITSEESTRRVIYLSPLPRKLFGETSVVWISHANEELVNILEESRNNAEKLKKTTRMWDLLINSLPVFIYTKNPDDHFRYQFGNKTFLDFFNLTLEELQNQDASFVLSPEESEKLRMIDSELIANPGVTIEKNMKFALPRQPVRYYQVVQQGIVNPDGTRTILAMAFDATEQEMARQETALRLQEKNVLLARFEKASELANIAVFQLNPITLEISGSKKLYDLCPIKDGKLLPIREWMMDDDFHRNSRLIQALHENTSSEETFDFRTLWFGDIRYYRTQLTRDLNADGSYSFSGVVQDITAITKEAGQLKDSQELWDMVINSIPTMFFAKDPNNSFRYVLCNRAFAAFLGKTQEEILGKNDAELFFRKEDETHFLSKDLAAMKKARGETYDETVMNAKGGIRRIQTTKKPFFAADGRKLLIGASNDITEFTQLLAYERTYSNMLSQVTGSGNYNNALNNVASTLTTHLHANNIMLFRLAEDGKVSFRKSWCEDGKDNPSGVTPEIEVTLVQQELEALQRNELLCAETLNAYPILAAYAKQHPDYKVQSLLAAPIFNLGKLSGIILTTFPVKTHFNSSDKKMIRAMANVITLAMTREAQQQELRQAVEEKQQILDNIDIPIWLFDKKGTMISVNRSVLSLQQSAALPSQLFEQPDDHLKLKLNELITATLCNGIATQHEIVFRRRHYIVSANPVRGIGGIVEFVVASAVDVTALVSTLANSTVLNSCMEICFREQNASIAMKTILSMICRHTKASRCYIMKVDNEKQQLNLLCEYVSKGRVPIMEQQNEIPFSPEMRWYQLYKRKENLIFPDINSQDCIDILGDWQKFFFTNNAKSLYCAGLNSNGLPVADIGIVYEDMPHASFSSSELAFLKGATHLIELLMARQESQRQLDAMMAELRNANHAKDALIRNESVVRFCLENLLRERDMKKAIASSLEMVCNHLGASRCYIFQFNLQERTLSCFSEYAKAGRKLIFSDIINQKMAPSPCWTDRFQTESLISIPDLFQTIDADGICNWRTVIESADIRSMYCHRILLDSKIWGYIGFMFERQPYHMDINELNFIASVANCVQLMLIHTNIQKQLYDAMQHAQAADKAKSFFIASVSHEIRTPLNAVLGFSELLRDGNLSQAEQRSYLDAIASGSNALLQLINDVLDLSKLEADQMAIILESCDFKALGTEVLHIFRHKAEENQLSLRIDIPDMPQLKLDVLRIRQILFNLFGNAVKFTPHGSVTLWAKFQPQDDHTGTLEFGVTDTGIGINPEDCRRLMEPFVQLSKLRGSNSGNNGTGLGLSICRRLVEKMNGTITIESELNKGSTFRITLSQVLFEAAPKNAAGSDQSALQLPTPGIGLLSVLVVDDVPMNRKVLQAMCQKCGVGKITLASTAEEAWEKIQQESFGLVLTDMWMPGMNGAQLLSAIRADKRFAAIPVVAVTADIDTQNTFEMKDFSGILLKPVTLEKLQQLLAALT